MDLYIKKFSSFETVAMFEVDDWSLPIETTSSGGSGSVTIPIENEDYSGYWAVIGNHLAYISTVSYDLNGTCSLTLNNPVEAFNRDGLYPTSAEQTYGAIIESLLTSEFIECTDSEYNASYLSVENYDSTSVTEDDPDTLLNISEAMYSALEHGVIFEWVIDYAGITLKIFTSTGTTHYVPVDDGHTVVSSIDVSDKSVSKVSVYIESQDEGTYTLYEYYLDENNNISTTEPTVRAKGKWSVITGSSDDDPEELAIEEFEDNIASYSIEAYSDYIFHVGEDVIIDLPMGQYTLQVTEVSIGHDTEGFYKYKFGKLPVSLTDKLESGEIGSGGTTTIVKSYNGVSQKIMENYVDNAISNIQIPAATGGGSGGGGGGSSGSTDWSDITNKPTTFTPSAHNHVVADITNFPEIPTDTSDLTNGAGFITSAQVPDPTYFCLTEDIVTVTTTQTKGVSPYNTGYYYTNFEISENAGISWVEGGCYSFVVDSSMTVGSNYRNLRVRIGSSDAWHPVCGYNSSIINASTYFKDSMTLLFVYKTSLYDYGSLHQLYDANTNYYLPLCTNGASTAAKSANASHNPSALVSGMLYPVTFSYGNTATSNVTFNLNGLGAKSIFLNGSVIDSNNYDIPKGTWNMYYDGTNWHIRTDGKHPNPSLNTTYSNYVEAGYGISLTPISGSDKCTVAINLPNANGVGF